jgi:hypothetical protein
MAPIAPAFPDKAEAIIAQFIRKDFMELGRGLNRATLK